MARQFEAGQAWTFKNAPLPESRVVVARVEDIEGYGPAISICVTDILLPNEAGEMRRNAISHAPITPEALEGSVVALVGTGDLVEGFGDAYREWRELLAAGETSCFVIPVDEIVHFFGEAMFKGTPAF